MKCPICKGTDVVEDEDSATAYCKECGYWWHTDWIVLQEEHHKSRENGR